jgi:hypothetical protein
MSKHQHTAFNFNLNISSIQRHYRDTKNLHEAKNITFLFLTVSVSAYTVHPKGTRVRPALAWVN